MKVSLRDWEEYCDDEQSRALNFCPCCGGWGNHGYDDEERLYTCYTCCGTGKYFDEVA